MACQGTISKGWCVYCAGILVAPLFERWLEENYPDRKAKVLGLLRETRGGTLYRSGFGERMRGTGVYAELLAQRFERASARHGLAKRPAAQATDRFRPPRRRSAQLDLFSALSSGRSTD